MTSDDHAYNGEIVMKGIRVVSNFECLSCLVRDHARTWLRSNFGVSVSREGGRTGLSREIFLGERVSARLGKGQA